MGTQQRKGDQVNTDLIRRELTDGLAYAMASYIFKLSAGNANGVLRAQNAIDRIEAALAELDNSRERQEGGAE